jgi:hypothetical protein
VVLLTLNRDFYATKLSQQQDSFNSTTFQAERPETSASFGTSKLVVCHRLMFQVFATTSRLRACDVYEKWKG